MNLTIVIPNYNGELLFRKNLPRVLSSAPGAEIIVVDDKSDDNSVAILRKEFPTITVITKEKNEGFASTVNVGVAAASHELVMLLNSDAYPESGFFDAIEHQFDDPNVFAVGLLQKSYEDGSIVTRGRGIGRFMHGFLMHSRGETDKNTTLWVSGGAGVFRKRIWDELQGMDTLYNPFYWEDVDLSYRAVKAGYTIRFEAASIVSHEQSIGSIRTKYAPDIIKTISYRNQFLFVWLNITDWKYILLHLCWLPYYLVRAVLTQDWPFIAAVKVALDHIREVMQGRKKRASKMRKSDREVFILS